jgi:cell wall-associated NlpC family hydrolase
VIAVASNPIFESARAYVGIPFKRGGATEAGADCWGLVCLFYREQLGIDLDATLAARYWLSDARDRGGLVAAAAMREPWQWVPVGCERPGDVLLFAIGGYPAHVGICLDSTRMLHAAADAVGAVVEPWTGPQWGPRFMEAYRHRGAAPC